MKFETKYIFLFHKYISLSLSVCKTYLAYIVWPQIYIYWGVVGMNICMKQHFQTQAYFGMFGVNAASLGLIC